MARISAEELRVQSQIDILIGRIARGENLISNINEFDQLFKDLIVTIDAALARARKDGATGT